MFSETLVLKGGGGQNDPLTNSKTKDATRTKLYVIYLLKINKLDFPNFHCSTVCSYCSIWCLIIKSRSKTVKISDASYENVTHRVDSPFYEDSKNIIFLVREALISGEGRPENLGKWPKTGKPIVMQMREWSILIRNTGVYSLVSKSLHYLCFPACQIKLFAKN